MSKLQKEFKIQCKNCKSERVIIRTVYVETQPKIEVKCNNCLTIVIKE